MPFVSPELQAFANGFPTTLLHAVVTLAILALGVALHAWLTPYKDVEEVREGNSAAAVSLGGAMICLAIPLGVSMAVSTSVVEVLVWGLAAGIIQLLASRLTDMILKGLPERIKEGEISAAVLLVAAKLAVAIILACAIS
jgi:putative membrane protein